MFRVSARNCLKGTITNIIEGTVNYEVTIRLAGGEEVVSLITRISCENLGLKLGEEAYVVIKASSIMIAKE